MALEEIELYRRRYRDIVKMHSMVWDLSELINSISPVNRIAKSKDKIIVRIQINSPGRMQKASKQGCLKQSNILVVLFDLY